MSLPIYVDDHLQFCSDFFKGKEYNNVNTPPLESYNSLSMARTGDKPILNFQNNAVPSLKTLKGDKNNNFNLNINPEDENTKKTMNNVLIATKKLRIREKFTDM